MKIKQRLTKFSSFYWVDRSTYNGDICIEFVKEFLGYLPETIEITATTVRPGKQGWRKIENLSWSEKVVISGRKSPFTVHSGVRELIGQLNYPKTLWIKMEPVLL